MPAEKWVKTGPENSCDPKFGIYVLNNLYIDYNYIEFAKCLKTDFGGKSELTAEKWVKTCPENSGDPKFGIYVFFYVYIYYKILKFSNSILCHFAGKS